MGKLIHQQPDPLPFAPLRVDRIEYHWKTLQEDRLAFDDFTPLDKPSFFNFVLGPNSVSYEIGDGVGLATIVVDGCNAWLQLVMYDWKYRDDVCLGLVDKAFAIGVNRVTTTVTEDRSHARMLMIKHGFVLEGKMRKAYKRWVTDDMGSWQLERFIDIEIYGLTREEHYGNSSGDSSSSDRGSGVDRGSSAQCQRS
jgi:hypothetical protein